MSSTGRYLCDDCCKDTDDFFIQPTYCTKFTFCVQVETRDFQWGPSRDNFVTLYRTVPYSYKRNLSELMLSEWMELEGIIEILILIARWI